MKVTKHIWYYILGGVSFEVVDASIVSKTEEGVEDSQKDAFVSADFIPAKTLRRLNSRRGVSNQNCLWIRVEKIGRKISRFSGLYVFHIKNCFCLENTSDFNWGSISTSCL